MTSADGMFDPPDSGALSGCEPANDGPSRSPAQVVELQTKVREVFTITEKAPTTTFSWLKTVPQYI